MKVSEIMATNVKTCGAETPLSTVAGIAGTLDTGTIPVVDSAGRLIGLITQRDLCEVLANPEKEAAQLAARDVMETGCASCSAGDDVRSVLRMLRERHLRQVPVVTQQGFLCGMLSLSDLILNAQHEARENRLSDSEVMRVMQAISADRCRSMRLRVKIC